MMAHNSTCFLVFRRYLKEHDLGVRGGLA
jgi:hypothetical protein